MIERLQRYLEASSGELEADELLAQVLPGEGADAEFGRSFLRSLLAQDPRFEENPSTSTWRLAANHLLEVPVAEAPMVVVDLETTGQRADETGLTEIGAVRMNGSEEVGRFDRLINPGRPIPPYVAKLTGISDEMVRDAPPIEDVIGEFVEFASDAVIVAHNAAFDVQVLDHLCRTILGRPLRAPALCTLKLCRRLMPELDRASLDALGAHFGLSADGSRHRAMADAELTAEILRRLLPLMDGGHHATVGELITAQEDPDSRSRLVIRVTRPCLESLPSGPGVYWLVDAEGTTLFVGSAANVRVQVCSYFLAASHMSDRQLTMISSTVDVGYRATTSDAECTLAEAEEVRRRKPEYNRNGRHLPRGYYVKLSSRRPQPRVMVASKLSRDGEIYLGPIRGRSFADDVARLLADLYGLPLRLDGELPGVEAKELAARAAELEKDLRTGASALRSALQRRGEEDRRASGIISRLGKLGRRRSWLVNCHSSLVAVPVTGPALLVYLVIDGFCRYDSRIETEEELNAFIEDASRAAGERRRRITPFYADASTIFSHWIRLAPADTEALFFDLDRNSVRESLVSVADDLRTIVASHAGGG